MTYFDDQHFENLTELEPGEYTDCQFQACSLPKAHLAGYRFIECTFTDCDLSLAVITDVAFQNVGFKNCKLLGLHFDECQPMLLNFHFDNCQIQHASFLRLSIKGTHFINCLMEGADFSGATLDNSRFDGTNLLNATFENCSLKNADFSGSINFSINPELNKMLGAKFSSTSLAGLLQKYRLNII
jgi:uncharacterized protein YjbI with pentapeptide repeats